MVHFFSHLIFLQLLWCCVQHLYYSGVFVSAFMFMASYFTTVVLLHRTNNTTILLINFMLADIFPLQRNVLSDC